MKKDELRALLLKPAERKIEEVPIGDLLPEGATEEERAAAKIIVKGMTAKEKGVFDLSFMKDGRPDIQKQRQMRERLIVACCFDGDNQKVFTVEDVIALSQQAIHVVDRLYEAADRCCSATQVDTLEKK